MPIEFGFPTQTSSLNTTNLNQKLHCAKPLIIRLRARFCVKIHRVQEASAFAFHVAALAQQNWPTTTHINQQSVDHQPTNHSTIIDHQPTAPMVHNCWLTIPPSHQPLLCWAPPRHKWTRPNRRAAPWAPFSARWRRNWYKCSYINQSTVAGNHNGYLDWLCGWFNIYHVSHIGWPMIDSLSMAIYQPSSFEI